MGSYQVQRGNKLQSSRIHYLLLTGCICIFLLGCGNPSRKKLSRILEQTETLAILSVPDRCEPHFYPSSEFSWDGMWGGVSKGATDGFEEIPDFVWEYDYYPFRYCSPDILICSRSSRGDRRRCFKGSRNAASYEVPFQICSFQCV